jgi:hypothetical protein
MKTDRETQKTVSREGFCFLEKQVKLLKIVFEKVEREHIFEVFGQLTLVFTRRSPGEANSTKLL